MSKGKEVNLQVKWNTHKVFVGDICYALDRDIYHSVWGDTMDYEDGAIKNYAVVAGTEYGDGCYEGNETSYSVDAGVIGVTDIDGSYYNVMGLPVQRIWAELNKVEN